jgi:hypothetical protein
VETAVSQFSPQFLADILFGADVLKFQQMLPSDEMESNSIFSRIDDRDIGGGTIAGQSRLSLGDPGDGKVGYDYGHEILSAFRSSIIRATPAGKGTWQLEYDMIAARALLYVVRGRSEAIVDIAKMIDKRCRQAAEFLSDIPSSVERFAGSRLSSMVLGLNKQKPKEGGKIEAAIMNVLFRGYGDLNNLSTLMKDMVQLKSMLRTDGTPVYLVPVTDSSSYAEMCTRCCAFPALDADLADGALRAGMSSAQAWVQLGTFHLLTRIRLMMLSMLTNFFSHQMPSAPC